MRILRFSQGVAAKYGILENETRIREISGSIYEHFERGSNIYNLEEVNLLAPCAPSKIICVGLNYKSHIKEFKTDSASFKKDSAGFARDGAALPVEPVLFLKPPTAVTGHGSGIVYPRMCSQVDYEAELAVVIGKKARAVNPAEVPDIILGYTCANDVTARDLQKRDGQWTRAKSFDTFAPLGPWIETRLDPGNLGIRLFLNGELKQDSNTGRMIFPVPELVSFISGIMTLLPGDVIMTGTPEGVGPMKAGDTVKVVVEGIGGLENTVV